MNIMISLLNIIKIPQQIYEITIMLLIIHQLIVTIMNTKLI